MLITTHTGLVVNSDHVAYIALRSQKTEDRRQKTEATGNAEPRFKALLCLATGESVVAATGLTQTAAQFLRQDMAHRWAEGCPTFDVNASLRRHREGAYFASDGEENVGKKRR